MQQSTELVLILKNIGLTQLESEVYVCLLQISPATGYKVANAIGRSFPNTYRAINGLREKGAVLVDEGASKVVRAVPVEDLFSHYQSHLQTMKRQAIAAADNLPQSSEDTRIYQLDSVPLVFQRCEHMLAEAEERVLLELFPEPAETLRTAVEGTAERGVTVAARVYQPAVLAGVHIVHSPFGEQTLKMFRSQWVAIFVDGRQFLLAHLMSGAQGVYQAIWSRNPFLARAFYDYVNSDLFHYAFRKRFDAARSLDEARAAYREMEQLFPPGGDIGFKEMQALINNKSSGPTP